MNRRYLALRWPSWRRRTSCHKRRRRTCAAARPFAVGDSIWSPLPFDAEAARAYGRIFAASKAAGRTSRACLADLLIAATAVANNLPLYTRNPKDFSRLDRIVKVVGI